MDTDKAERFRPHTKEQAFEQFIEYLHSQVGRGERLTEQDGGYNYHWRGEYNKEGDSLVSIDRLHFDRNYRDNDRSIRLTSVSDNDMRLASHITTFSLRASRLPQSPEELQYIEQQKQERPYTMALSRGKVDDYLMFIPHEVREFSREHDIFYEVGDKTVVYAKTEAELQELSAHFTDKFSKESIKIEFGNLENVSYIAKTDIRLKTSYEDRALANELGAKWDQAKGAWYIPKGTAIEAFQQQEGWLPADGKLPALRQTILYVPFVDKEQVKALGAQWKPTADSWILPQGADSRAIPDKFYEAPKQQERTVEKSFETFAAEMGVIIIGEAIADGQLHRVAVEGGKPKAKDGAYLLHDDSNGRSGYVQNFKTGEKATFGEKSAEKVVTPKSKEELEQIKTARNEEIKHTQDEAAKKADYLVKSVFKPAETHKYLETKGIEPHGALIENSGALVVSLQNIKGEIRSFQRIEEDGRKVFITGGQKQGCFHAIGQLEGAKQILICEGFATGASLNEATGKPIVCAMDAGNLKTVALAIKEKYGEAELIIAGDNDHKAEKNLGKQAAEEAAKACGGKAVIPQFTPAQMAKGCTDFNDLAKEDGKLAVRKQISEATKEQSKETAKSHDKDRSM